MKSTELYFCVFLRSSLVSNLAFSSLHSCKRFNFFIGFSLAKTAELPRCFLKGRQLKIILELFHH